jgi:LuxR family transcriptional regulator, maltose regulon positive regulatory protein
MKDGDGRPDGVDGTRPVDPRFAVPLATNVVLRPRLHAQLTADLAPPCVLITAPAGWGKTLLASSWLHGGATDTVAAWISLGPAEDDLRGFWVSVTAALIPVVGDSAAAALRSAVTDDLEQVPGNVAAALTTHGPRDLVLVLDNLHEVTGLAVHESLLRLVQRPPQGLRFVVMTRRDPPWPLNQLRLAGVLSEIRASDLAFTVNETHALLDGLGIELDAEHVGRLVARTEGWAAGLRLAAFELHDAADPAGLVDAFSGDDHAVAAYLLDEVIEGLAPELLDFLVRISILDVVSADLADAMTDSQSGAHTLAELATSNLLVHAVGTSGRWYRLHRLIADILRTRITQRRTFRDLHRRAAHWYLRQAMPLEAVRYALRGGLWPLAAELLGVHVLALVIKGDAREIDMLLTAVPRNVLLSHPELAAALAVTRLHQASPRELADLIAAARAGVERLPGPRGKRLRLVLDLNEISVGRASGDLLAVAATCRGIPQDPATLATLGLAAWDIIPLIVLGNAGMAAFWTGEPVEAEKHLLAAVDYDRSSGITRPHLNAAAHLALLRCEQGDLDAAQARAQAVVEQATDAGWTVSVQVVAAYLTLAWVALDRDDHPDADGWFARIAEVEAIMPEPHIQLTAAALTALRRADAGDPMGALSDLRLTTARLAGNTPPALTDRLAHVEAELLCRVGDIEQAKQVLAGLHGPPTAASARSLARLSLSAADPATAEQALAPFPNDGATVRGQVEGAILRSIIAAPHDHATALSQLDSALLAAAPLGMRRPFLIHAAALRELLNARIEAGTAAAAFAVDLMRRMSGQNSRPPATLAEPLTDREQQVLRYLASTLSNAEIASELYLSINTVKTHQRMIYRKLGADGRRDAVRRAKELRLL